MFFENTKELAEHKLILLYILDKVDFPLTNSDITQIILENNHMNYFYIQQYLSELNKANLINIIKKDNNDYYELSELGRKTLIYFMQRIPKKTKELINEKFEEKIEKRRKETQIIGDYYKKSESEYICNLKVIENEITLFNLSLNVVSSKQAKLICTNWKKNPHDIYKKIFDIIIDD